MKGVKERLWLFWQRYGRPGLIGFGLGLLILGFWTQSATKPETIEFLPSEEASTPILVDVAGAVIQPGVYQLPPGSRVNQAIKAAGGLSQEADFAWIERHLNLARKLTDGEKLYFPRQGELAAEAGTTLGRKTINLNQATPAELETLPGIGPAMAERIVSYRQKQGGFKTVEELMAVPGIGPKTFVRIKDQLSL